MWPVLPLLAPLGVVPIVWSVPTDGTFAAVAALASDGDTIELLQDTAPEELPVVLTARITVRGQGAAATAIAMPARALIVAADVTFEDLTFDGTAASRVLTVAGPTVTLNRAVVQNGAAPDRGGCVSVTGGAMIATDTTFRGCAAPTGGALAVDSAAVTCVRCTFEANDATGDGGAVWLWYARPSSFTDATLRSSTAGGAGGGIAAFGSTVAVVGGAFDGDGAGTIGGAIAVGAAGAITVTPSAFGGTLFTGGSAASGGAIGCVDAGCAVSVTGATLTDGAATDGGHLYASSGVITVIDSTLSLGHAERDGGAIRVDAGSTLTVVDTALLDNDAGARGGAIAATGAATSLARVRACDNHADDAGGAIRWTDPGSTDVRNLSALRNSAGATGGAVSIDGGAVPILQSTFVGNDAPDGAALDAEAPGVSLTGVVVTQSVHGVAVDGPVAVATWAGFGNGAGDLGPEAIPSDPVALTTDPLPVLPADCTEAIPVFGGELVDRSIGLDPDGTPADLGATGGPDADPDLWLADGDPVPAMWDCEPFSDLAYPGNVEVPGDDIDNDCLDGDAPA
ncbi:MAG: hypothetical protein ABMB14_36650, partial [Myxococcota bacterium]